jgi:hypothetical protein
MKNVGGCTMLKARGRVLSMTRFRSLPRAAGLIGVALAAAALAVVFLPTPAKAWFRGGVYVGVAPPPFFYPPPFYYGPPVYYPPPPAYYGAPPLAYAAPPPPAATAPAAQSCYAGPLVCPMEHPSATGNTCWCTGSSGRVYGQVH